MRNWQDREMLYRNKSGSLKHQTHTVRLQNNLDKQYCSSWDCRLSTYITLETKYYLPDASFFNQVQYSVPLLAAPRVQIHGSIYLPISSHAWPHNSHVLCHMRDTQRCLLVYDSGVALGTVARRKTRIWRMILRGFNP